MAVSQPIPDELRKQERPKNAKLLFWLIAIVAGFGLIGGMVSIKTSIEQPLAILKPNTNALALDIQPNEEEQLIALKNKDSDKDGLTDYQELYEFGSSPYLADSDSDGIQDKQEVDNGDDPNCPKDTECTPIAVFTPGSSVGNTNNPTNTSTTVDVGSIDPNELRTLLRNSGAPQAELDALSDAELVALYQQVLAEQESTNANATNQATNTNSGIPSDVSFQELENLSAAEIRQLLILGGADEASLSQIDDATLRTIYLESIQNLQGQSTTNTNS